MSGRPETRGECSWAVEGMPGCPFVTCRHHLWTGDRAERFADLVDRDPDQWPQTCSLDVADWVYDHLDELPNRRLGHGAIGKVMGFSRELSRLLQIRALDAFESSELADELRGEDDKPIPAWSLMRKVDKWRSEGEAKRDHRPQE